VITVSSGDCIVTDIPILTQGPETLRETSFVQSFGHDLQAAREHCRRFRMSGEVSELNQAWDIYYLVSMFPIHFRVAMTESDET
jgi:phosphatidylinositol kinase/protein kinase (PI-3  family)